MNIHVQFGFNNQTSQEWSLEGPLQSLCYFYADRKFKMATTAGHRLALDPMGKYSNAFFSETTNMIKAKLYMNVHWMVLYNPMNIHVQFGFNHICSF
jgi:hypothetical protein